VNLMKCSLLFVLAAGCSAMPSGSTQQPVAERFRAKLAEYERLCASGHYNDASTGCRLLKLSPRNFDGPGLVRVEGQPLPIPKEWVATKEGQFAHSIKLPQPLGADSGYSEGMSSQEYFEHLCAKEAGEFIYRTVDKVEGLMQLRPRSFAGGALMNHPYVIEDPYGHTAGLVEFSSYVYPLRYNFFETPARDLSRASPYQRKGFHPSYFLAPKPGQVIERISGYDGRHDLTAKKEFAVSPAASYGYVWRGVRRSNDRNMGIAGGELIVLDLQTHEVLGVRRGFVYASRMKEPSYSGIDWEFGAVCPRYNLEARGGRSKDGDFEYWFIRKVLKPVNLTRPEPYLDVKGN
jgi:hypothetical protein